MSQKVDFGVKTPVVALNSGHNMPFIAIGTTSSKIPYPSNEEFKISILEAIKVGYRHIDTAAMYGSEEGTGLAVEEALQTGLVKSRDELFVTTKLGCNDARPDCVLPAITESLRKLGLAYVDMYLIHAPMTISSASHVSDMTLKKGDISPMDIESVWAAMEEVHKLGLAKSIGVSNFTCKKLTELLAHANIIPAVNQVEMHPAMQQKKLREFCKEKGIHVSAYSPLGGKEWGFDVVLGNELLKEIAQNKKKSIAQIALRWGYEQEASMVVKSFNRARLEENVDIFNWNLTEEELKKMELNVPQTRTSTLSDFVFADGPFKTVDELWDGEM
ncbi:hypothetical protein Scep_022591 [Stephania cephalantha]|uniref:codeinone reductase (NADPH) n=1 Tax=Stephania cephalantha TaxID=152367 RepID=A0AAP0I131_9MAGN